MNACDARFRCRCCSPGEIRSRSRMHARARARDTHTQLTMTLQGRRAGTACWLAGVVEGLLRNFTYSRQLSQARPRTASTSLTLRPLHEGAATARWRSSKTRQTRIQFRLTPGEFDLTVYLRNLRNLPLSHVIWGKEKLGVKGHRRRCHRCCRVQLIIQ